MAGEWIKMRASLQTHPKVVRISSAMRCERFLIVGALHAVWCLFDTHSEDGLLVGYDRDSLDGLINFPGFAAALIGVGWLVQSDDGLKIPEFSTHNGQSAKRRATEAERKRASREVPQSVRNLSANVPLKSGTREEKRREEEKSNALSGKPDESKRNREAAFKTEAVEVLKFLNEKAERNYQPVDANLDFIIARLKEGATPQQLRQVVVKKAREWRDKPDMEIYIRPATLFNRMKFAQYVGELMPDKEPEHELS